MAPRPSASWTAPSAASEPSTTPTRLLEPDPRTALGARDGLGMEAAVGRIVVFLRAGVAERERAHGGVRTVIGELHRDREPGPAVGAVDEGVAGAAVRRIGHLGHAVVADGDIGRHEGPHGAVSGALDDAEPDLLRCRASHGVDTEDPGQRRRVGDQTRRESLDHVGRTLDLDEHALGVVADVPGETQLAGQAVHERSEAHPLDDPDHPDAAPHRGVRRGQRGHTASWLRRPRVTAASRCIRPKL